MLNVGIIGVGEHGWGREAHVPSVQATDGLTLAAVATRDQHSADEAAATLGAERGYGDPRDLIADPAIDIVTVATPVPTHHDLIVAALRAGKHVVTEWPVGVSTAQTQEIAAIAERSGRFTAVGLQARLNPSATRAREFLQAQMIGRVLNATVYSTTAAFGQRIPAGARYLEDPGAGMNLTTIQAAHTIDFALRLTGPLASLAALRTVQFPNIVVDEGGEQLHRTVPDHVLLQGRLRAGGALSVQVVGGRPPGDTPFRMDIAGEYGTITLTGGASRGFQSGLLDLSLNGCPVEVNHDANDIHESAVNVARIYAALRDDITSGASTAPNFTHAVRLSHLIDDLIDSAERQGTVTPTAEWPY